MRSRQDSSHCGQNPVQVLPVGSRGAVVSFHRLGLALLIEAEGRSSSDVDLGSAEREC